MRVWKDDHLNIASCANRAALLVARKTFFFAMSVLLTRSQAVTAKAPGLTCEREPLPAVIFCGGF